MTLLNDEEKKRIEEEEDIRAKVRLRFEQKSVGVAGVLSSICPGLGQIYNGQTGKATLIRVIVLIGLLLLVAGILFQIRGIPAKGQPMVEMTEEGIVIEEPIPAEQPAEKKPIMPIVLIVIGAAVIITSWSYSIKDAVKSAKRINNSY